MSEQESAAIVSLFILAAMGIFFLAGMVLGWGRGFAAGWNAHKWATSRTAKE